MATFYRADAELMVAQCKHDGTMDEQTRSKAATTRLDAAKTTYEAVATKSRDIEQLFVWSNNWRKAALGTATTKAQRLAAYEAHLERMRRLQVAMKKGHDEQWAPDWYLWATEYYRTDAEILLLEEKTKPW
jgi:hypothetical protein